MAPIAQPHPFGTCTISPDPIFAPVAFAKVLLVVLFGMQIPLSVVISGGMQRCWNKLMHLLMHIDGGTYHIRIIFILRSSERGYYDVANSRGLGNNLIYS